MDQDKHGKREGGEIDVVRYFKDENYRKGLTAEQRARLPKHPAGELKPTDDVLVAMRQSLKTDPECYSTRTEIQGCTCPK